jgi:hypothetical protein
MASHGPPANRWPNLPASYDQSPPLAVPPPVFKARAAEVPPSIPDIPPQVTLDNGMPTLPRPVPPTILATSPHALAAPAPFLEPSTPTVHPVMPPSLTPQNTALTSNVPPIMPHAAPLSTSKPKSAFPTDVSALQGPESLVTLSTFRCLLGIPQDSPPLPRSSETHMTPVIFRGVKALYRTRPTPFAHSQMVKVAVMPPGSGDEHILRHLEGRGRNMA